MFFQVHRRATKMIKRMEELPYERLKRWKLFSLNKTKKTGGNKIKVD